MSADNHTALSAMDAVVARATTDRSFRDQLLTDPRRAIQDGFGVQIPPTVRIRCIERDADVDALIVLPDFTAARAAAGDELSDDELDTVAGGQGQSAGWSRPIIKLPPPPAV